MKIFSFFILFPHPKFSSIILHYSVFKQTGQLTIASIMPCSQRHSPSVSGMNGRLMSDLCFQRIMGQKIARGIDSLCSLLHLLCLHSAFLKYSREECVHPHLKEAPQSSGTMKQPERWLIFFKSTSPLPPHWRCPATNIPHLDDTMQCNATLPQTVSWGHICPSLPSTAVIVLF